MTAAVASVVIPAHNEASVIGRCLDTLLAGTRPGELEVCVAANGCTDDTVARARRDGVTVLELAQPGKAAALQAADAAVQTFPRVYLDADVELGADAVRDLAATLTAGGVEVASVTPRLDLTGCSPAVRAFYRIWQQLPWLSQDPVGNGVFALSAAGRGRFDRWPDIIADDLFAAQLFTDGERRCLPAHTFTIHPPRTVGSLLKVRRRVVLGNTELAARREAGTLPASRSVPTSATGRPLLALLARPGDRLAASVYITVVIWARVLAGQARRRGQLAWDRDLTSRG